MLDAKMGDPKTTYVNASDLKFPDLHQSFIATQAPKPNSFENFWQMILEKQVGGPLSQTKN